MRGMLSGGELARKYEKSFVIVEANAGSTYPEGHELRRLNDRKYTPVVVFLDAQGKTVHRSTGFSNPREGHALCDFVAGRHYRTTTYAAFLAAYRE